MRADDRAGVVSFSDSATTRMGLTSLATVEGSAAVDAALGQIRPASSVAARTSPTRGVLGSLHPCALLPIFSPGNGFPQATAHKMAAIDRLPEYVLLNDVPTDVRLMALPRSWFDRFPPCVGAPPATCDEYPYYASAQSGPKPGETPGTPESQRRFSLDVIDAVQNIADGGRYGHFVTSCGFALLAFLDISLDVPTSWVG